MSFRTVYGIGGVLLCALALLVPSAALAVDDTTAPEILDFSFSPTSVDTSAASATITLTARVTDDLAGVRSVGGAQFLSPSSGQSIVGQLSRVSGTALDGIYQGTVTVPQYAEQGTWTLVNLSTQDQADNFRRLDGSEIAAAGWPTTFENQGDATVPTTTISLAPATPGGQNGWYVSGVTVTVAATDDVGGSGVAETRCVLDPASVPATFDAIPAGCSYTGAGASVTGNGAHTIYAASKDVAGTKETPVSATFMIDQTNPTVTCDVASPGRLFLLLGSGGFVAATVTDATSGPVQNEAAAANVTTVGNKTVALTGKDVAGNTTNASCPYRVSYRFLGFQGLKSSYKSNQTIPVRFMLANAAGTPISDANAQSLLSPCRVKITFDNVEQTGCASYDATTDTFQYKLAAKGKGQSLPTGSHTIAIKVSAPDGSGVINTNGTTVTITS